MQPGGVAAGLAQTRQPRMVLNANLAFVGKDIGDFYNCSRCCRTADPEMAAWRMH